MLQNNRILQTTTASRPWSRTKARVHMLKHVLMDARLSVCVSDDVRTPNITYRPLGENTGLAKRRAGAPEAALPGARRYTGGGLGVQCASKV